MPHFLGLDTGGTYTDAVLMDTASGVVLAWAKAPTTPADLAVGLGEAMADVFTQPGAPRPEQVSLVGLSTTLATNALVEGRGRPTALVLIGYDQNLLAAFGLDKDLAAQAVIHVAGGHDHLGEELAPLDEAGLRRGVLARLGEVEAFAVSGYFSVRNPAHELRAKRLIEELTGRAVTCGHELSSELDSVRRATTVALNAGLTPLLRELVAAVQAASTRLGLKARLMVVRGDGSLVAAEWALARPIETILSGPAASAVGAWHLAGRVDPAAAKGTMWALDLGGTTTDIAFLTAGRPRLNRQGARVGRWRTMVEAVDVHTVGLGGDSLVRLDQGGQIILGPRRVLPLSRLAARHPQVQAELEAQQGRRPRLGAGQFLLLERRPSRNLSPAEADLLARLTAGPLSQDRLDEEARAAGLHLPPLARLEAERAVVRAGFTPTDALHVLGRLALGDAAAARLGARILARLAGREVADFCQAVVDAVARRAAEELVTKALRDEGLDPDWAGEPTAARLLAKGLGQAPPQALACRLALTAPLAVIGAPAPTFGGPMAELLQTALILPPQAGVANAVGAVAGGVALGRRVRISPLAGGRVRAHGLEGVIDFDDLEAAVAAVQSTVARRLAEEARLAGADQVQILVDRRDQRFHPGLNPLEEIYLGTVLELTALGRPSPAR